MRTKTVIYTVLGTLLLAVAGVYVFLGTPADVCNGIAQFKLGGGHTLKYLNLKTGEVQSFSQGYAPTRMAPDDFICGDDES